MDNTNNRGIVRGVVLEVPFKEKDEVKRLGARWDPEIRKWFVPKDRDEGPFARWIPESSASASE